MRKVLLWPGGQLQVGPVEASGEWASSHFEWTPTTPAVCAFHGIAPSEAPPPLFPDKSFICSQSMVLLHALCFLEKTNMIQPTFLYLGCSWVSLDAGEKSAAQGFLNYVLIKKGCLDMYTST